MLAVVAVLAGCRPTERNVPRADVHSAQDDLKECLRRQRSLAECDGYRLAADAERERRPGR